MPCCNRLTDPLIWLLVSVLLLFSSFSVAEEADISHMTDAEVRQTLMQMMTTPDENSGSGAQSTAADSSSMLEQVQQSSSRFEQSLALLKSSIERWDQQQQLIWQNLSAEQGWLGIGELLLLVGAMLLAGVLAEKLFGWRLLRLADNISHQNSSNWVTTLSYLSLRMVFNLIGVAVFGLGALVLALLVTEAQTPWRSALLAILSMLVTVRLVMVLAQAVLAPRAKGIRPLALHCQQAATIYWWVFAFSLYYAALVNGTGLAVSLGMEPVMVQLLLPSAGLLLNLLVNAFVWNQRATITQMFSNPDSRDTNLKQVVVQSWPILASIWLLSLWMLWGYTIFVGDRQAAEQLSISWWITLLFPLADRLFAALLANLVTIRLLQSPRFELRAKRFCSILQNGLRLILLALAVFFLAEGWGYKTMAMMEAGWIRQLLQALVDMLVIILVAFIAWELIQSAIERRLPEPPEQDSETPEGEGGGAGATRTETLLPLMRSFILAILVVTVVLSILSSLGVEIGPLLAGAGVVGIAVGFGAQKLVADVISGVFFLLDDAFRRGEYIEAASMRGTVENISIRSMRLRHHLGAVQTIPYSEIATVKNLSRDWVTMKLEFRLPYDTDVEKVRKIIKKIGLAMMDDEEMGPNIILPLKSQGVMRVEESALIFRMKFTSKPGEQWIIRREAYRRVKEGLEANGIHFAHRAVHVLMPQPENSEAQVEGHSGTQDAQSAPVDPKLAAAATTSAIAADLNRMNRIDSPDGEEDSR
ncbi:mechanosensitive ion channel family protein [Motiliproteus coralliicola]|uniref:Mechanosensitive ion channel family protein n=1 Tax=Motiliproteus coralliicola TaxID=2283196 RepID=A0A369WCP2_9GAMM|nr:mechanosensitive ion channel family protein [Motiliproteus coralliicola]RDE19502.1 mechanosensitive ion channel family protein [Motiliproteus coralliicola]